MQIDMQLPERSKSNILSILKSNNMPVRVPDENEFNFNCWGFVAYYCQWEKTAKWLGDYRIKNHLKAHTDPITKEEVKAGDIAVFYQGKYLTHTAIMLPDGKTVCHKPGANDLCINTIEAAAKSYGNAIYVRLKEKTEGGLTSDSVSV